MMSRQASAHKSASVRAPWDAPSQLELHPPPPACPRPPSPRGTASFNSERKPAPVKQIRASPPPASPAQNRVASFEMISASSQPANHLHPPSRHRIEEVHPDSWPLLAASLVMEMKVFDAKITQLASGDQIAKNFRLDLESFGRASMTKSRSGLPRSVTRLRSARLRPR